METSSSLLPQEDEGGNLRFSRSSTTGNPHRRHHHHHHHDHYRRRRKCCCGAWWGCCLLIFFLLLALGLGLGLGLGLRSSTTPGPVVIPNTTNTTTTTISTTTVAPTTTAPTTSVTPTTTTTTVTPTTTPTLCDVNDLYLSYSDLYYAEPQNLVLRNPVTNITQYIGVMDIEAEVLFVEPGTNQLWGGLSNNTGVYITQIDKITAQTTLICFIPGIFEVFTGRVGFSFQSNGDLWMFGNNSTNYVFYRIDLGLCTATAILANVPGSVTATFFNHTSVNDVFYLQRAATNFLYKAIVPSTPGVLVGNTGVFTSGGLTLIIFSYCLNNVPTLEMFWQQGTSDFQFRQLDPLTAAPSFNNVTFFNDTNINPAGVSAGCYCA